VIISENKKQEILSAISQAKHHDKIFEEWGFKDVFEKGTAITLLFWGIPGTGKTLTAQAIADHLGSKLKTYSTAEIETSEPGGAERNIKEIFARNKPKGKKKSVILFDECDSLLMDRNEVGAILGAQVNTLLTEIEKFDGILIFTTNRLGKLDPALERRISAKIEFEFPNEEQRLAIWKRMIPGKAPIHDDVDWISLSKFRLAGGHIKNAVLNAARSAAYAELEHIKMEHFVSASEKELKAIEAFLDEYNKNVHQHNYGKRSDFGQGDGLSVSKKALMGMKKIAGLNPTGGTE
jgi:SpoVK/Ycf46/Vps4 family AAA+-type ATPase